MDKFNTLFYEVATENSRQAFQLLFEEFYSPLCFYACRYLKSSQECEDLIQDVFFDLWDKRHEIAINDSFRSYILACVRNRCLNVIRRKRIKLDFEESMMRDECSNHDDIEELYSVSELEHRIKRVLNALPDNQRTAFMMSRYQNKTYQQIAEEMNVSIKSIEVYIGKALRSMRNELKEYLSLIIFLLPII